MVGTMHQHQSDVAVGQTWPDHLADELERLDRWIRNRILVAPDSRGTLIPATRFFEPDFLREIMAATSGFSPPEPGRPVDVKVAATDDPDLLMRIAASRFARAYASSLTVVSLVGLAHGIGIDVSPDRCAVSIGADKLFRFRVLVTDNELVKCADRPNPWGLGGRESQSVEELREFVWRRLYAAHLAPLFRLAAKVVQVGEALLWNSAGEYVAIISDAAQEYLPAAEAEIFVADRMALLAAPLLPGVAGANPLRDTVEWVPVDSGGVERFPQAVSIRRLCCLTYLLDERSGLLCQNCPHLPVPVCADMVRERHHVPKGPPSGPAIDRSRAIGQQRPSWRRLRKAGRP
jgi:ferric iron reductase protein FhuF